MLMSLLIEVYSSSNRTLHTDWYHTDTTDLAGVKHPLLRFNGKVVKATAKKDIENYLKCKKKKKKKGIHPFLPSNGTSELRASYW